MSAISSTDAIVLRSIRFQESSRIVTFYTRRFGRLAGIVKGARKNPAKFGVSLQPMAQVSLVVYRKPGREVQTVSHCDPAWVYRRIHADLDRMASGMQMVELVTMAARHEEENPELYALLEESLRSVDDEPDPGWAVLYRFELRLAAILGFRADFNACAICRRPEDGTWIPGGGMIRLDIERGGPLCPRCDRAAARAILTPGATLAILRDLNVPPGEWAGFGPPGRDRGRDPRVEAFLQAYFSYHLPGFRRLRSADVFERVAVPSAGGKR